MIKVLGAGGGGKSLYVRCAGHAGAVGRSYIHETCTVMCYFHMQCK